MLISFIIALFGFFDALVLWIVLSITSTSFGILVIKYTNPTFFIFYAIITGVNCITGPKLFIQKFEFKYSGWNAVKDFDFSIFTYLEITSYLMFFLVLMFIYILTISKVFKSKYIFKSQNKLKLIIKIKNDTSEYKSDMLLYLFLGSVCLVNVFMYNRGIGITGLTGSQIALPFKLAGILYYSTRFIVPFVIFIIYGKSTRSIFAFITITAYAFFAGISQLSRMTLIMLIVPIFILELKQSKYFRVIFLSILSLAMFTSIEFARSILLIDMNGLISKRSEVGLFYLIAESFFSMNIGSVTFGFFRVLDRLGGAQDIVLGFQYDTLSTGGVLSNFGRLFLLIESKLNIQQELYGFTPSFGYSVGSGGFISRIFQVCGGNLFGYIFLSAYVASIVLVGEQIRFWLQKNKKLSTYSNLHLFSFIAFLVAFGDMRWLYIYLTLFEIFIIASKSKYSIDRNHQ